MYVRTHTLYLCVHKLLVCRRVEKVDQYRFSRLLYQRNVNISNYKSYNNIRLMCFSRIIAIIDIFVAFNSSPRRC